MNPVWISAQPTDFLLSLYRACDALGTSGDDADLVDICRELADLGS